MLLEPGMSVGRDWTVPRIFVPIPLALQISERRDESGLMSNGTAGHRIYK